MVRKYLTVGLVFIALIIVWRAHAMGFDAGQQKERVKWQEIENQRNAEFLKLQKERAQLVNQLSDANTKTKIVNRDRIKKLNAVAGGCLDRPLPDDFRRLLNEG